MNNPDFSKDLICENLSVLDNTLYFAGQNTASLAKEYGTPLYLYDEDRIHKLCRIYVDAVKEAFGDKGHILYASKAASFKRMYEIVKEENMGIDVVSSGEIASAKKADFPLELAFFHSNNKTDNDIRYAIENGVGYFVVDGEDELYAIDEIAKMLNKKPNVILRITPGIDPHTYEEVATGKVDSKFGSAIETGQAKEITGIALDLKNITLKGFHCHVGSQVFDSSVYIATVFVMMAFINDMKDAFGYTAEILDLGGGYGVRYTSKDPEIDIYENILEVGRCIKEEADKYSLPLPHIYFEPGRSIVADAGLTLYTMGSLKKITGYKNYISVDGGMTDNPRFVLYGAEYTIVPAEKMGEARDMVCDIVGRCCESGDIIQEKVNMPSGMKRGDLVAVLTTGAYHYSMASNYNRIPRPPVVMLKGGKSYVAVKRETLEDITNLDI